MEEFCCFSFNIRLVASDVAGIEYNSASRFITLLVEAVRSSNSSRMSHRIDSISDILSNPSLTTSLATGSNVSDATDRTSSSKSFNLLHFMNKSFSKRSKKEEKGSGRKKQNMGTLVCGGNATRMKRKRKRRKRTLE